MAPASLKDLEEVYRLEVECFGREAYGKWIYRWLLRDSRTVFFKAVGEGGELMGFVAGRCEVEGRSVVGRVYTLNVGRRFRGRGVAEKLMKALEEEFRARGCVEAVLQVAADNEPAVKLYKKLGYALTRKLPNYYGLGRDGFEARKRLK